MLALQFMVAFAQFNKTTRDFEHSPTYSNMELLSKAIDVLLTYFEIDSSINSQYLDSVADTIIGKLYSLVTSPNIATMYMSELLDLIVLVSEARMKKK